MISTINEIREIAENATRRALVEIEELDGTIFVTVESEGHRQDRLAGDGDHCQGQNWIGAQARGVLAALKDAGWKQVPFSGRIDLGHSGGGCFFAMERA